MSLGKPIRRRAAVLLIVLFLMAITTPLVCLILEAHATTIRCTHNHIGATEALYVAEAGVQDAISELLLDRTWRAGFTDKALPPGLGHTYTVTVADAGGGNLTVTSTSHTASGYTKRVTATLSGF